MLSEGLGAARAKARPQRTADSPKARACRTTRKAAARRLERGVKSVTNSGQCPRSGQAASAAAPARTRRWGARGASMADAVSEAGACTVEGKAGA